MLETVFELFWESFKWDRYVPHKSVILLSFASVGAYASTIFAMAIVAIKINVGIKRKETMMDEKYLEGKMTQEEADQKYWIEAEYNTANLTEKIRLLEKGASYGGMLCQNGLGELYMTGNGVPKDLEKAAEYFLEAAKKGVPSAMYFLSLIYVNYWDDEQHFFEALNWLGESAKRCHIPAFAAIETNFKNEGLEELFIPLIKPKFVEIMKKERKEAMDYHFLGLCYIYGVACNKDEDKARMFIQKAADMGNAYSSFVLQCPHLRAELSVENNTL